MEINLDQFIREATDNGLVTADKIAAARDSLPPDKRDSGTVALAKALIAAGELTKYQAAAIYQGKAKGLVYGKYVVLDKLGAGGMGVVYKARHRTMDRLVALKVLSPKVVDSSPDAVKRFQQEVRAAAQLNHANIVTAHDADQRDNVHYLVMEYVEGEDLDERLKRDGPLPVDQAIHCIVQAAKGLEYAHQKGIIHRDIKPANLLIDHEGTVRILDMGLARMDNAVGSQQGAGGQPTRGLTQSGQIMGTCDYMAPEQAMDTKHATARSDIYSLGCTLYRLLTGHPPYGGDTVMKILMGHQKEPVPSLREERPEVSPALEAVYQQMMAKEPAQRLQTASELVASLETCLDVGGAAPPPLPARPSRAAAAEEGGELTAFLQGMPQPVIATKQAAKTKQAEETADFTPGQDTDEQIGQRPAPVPGLPATPPPPTVDAATPAPPRHASRTAAGSAAKKKTSLTADRKKLILFGGIGLAAAAGLIGIIVLAIVVTAETPWGTIVVEAEDDSVQVAVLQGGQEIELVDADRNWTLRVDRGEYRLELRGGDDEFQLDQETVTVSRDGEVRVRVKRKPRQVAEAREPPGSAIAPLDTDPASSDVAPDEASPAEIAAPTPDAPHDTPPPERAAPFDADRRAAEWVLGLGGSVSVVDVNGQRQAQKVEELGDGPFRLVALAVSNREAASGLENLIGLSELRVSNFPWVPITDAHLEILDGSGKLFSAGLRGTKVTDAGVIRFIDKHPKLTEAHLATTAVTDAVLAHIGQCARFTLVDVENTAVTDAGLRHLESLPELGSICVSGPGVTPAGIKNLYVHTKLRHLSLHDMALGDDDVAAFSKWDRLTSVSLSDTRVSDAGVAALVRQESLGHVYLPGTPITDAALEHLAKLPRLGRLSVTRTAVTKAGLERFRRARPSCCVLRDEPLFDGKSLAGWRASGAGKWTVQNGVIVGRTGAGETGVGGILLQRGVDSCTLRLEFKPVAGDSRVRIFFRGPSGITGSPVDFPLEHPDIPLRRDDWNSLIMSFRPDSLSVFVNGVGADFVVDLPDEGPGHMVSLTLQGERGEVQFRDIALEVEDRGAAEPQSSPQVQATPPPQTQRPPQKSEQVAAGLAWLAAHQLDDGGWNCDHTRAPGCRGQCRHAGSIEVPAAATSLAVLSFLMAGDTHMQGDHRDVVKRGLDFLVRRADVSPHGASYIEPKGTMYAHGLATRALCDAYAMTRDKELKEPAQKAIDFIAHAQDPVGGGWRYGPQMPGDTSVTGWQLLALKSGHMAYLEVPPTAIKGGIRFLDSVQGDSFRFGYTTPAEGDVPPALTAIGLTCRIYLGWKREHPTLQQGIAWLADEGPQSDNPYFNYFATQAIRAYGGPAWERWHPAIQGLYQRTQATAGHEAGSWHFEGGLHGAENAGRLYCTTMALMTLQLQNRDSVLAGK